MVEKANFYNDYFCERKWIFPYISFCVKRTKRMATITSFSLDSVVCICVHVCACRGLELGASNELSNLNSTQTQLEEKLESSLA